MPKRSSIYLHDCDPEMDNRDSGDEFLTLLMILELLTLCYQYSCS